MRRINVSRIRRQIQRGRQRGGLTVTLHWKTVTGGTQDPTTGYVVGQLKTDQELSVRAFVEWIKPGDRRLEFHQAFEVNDVVIDFPETVEVDGKQDLYFEVEGKSYVPKNLGDRVPESWDAVVNGKRIGRMVLARLKL